MVDDVASIMCTHCIAISCCGDAGGDDEVLRWDKPEIVHAAFWGRARKTKVTSRASRRL